MLPRRSLSAVTSSPKAKRLTLFTSSLQRDSRAAIEKLGHAIADIEDTSVKVLGQPTPLRAGMGGRAEIVIAKRSLISIAFDPIRQLRENMVSPPEREPNPAAISQGKE